jgi:hypothetical protein
MVVVPLVCPSCGAPLPAATSASIAACVYCGATVRLRDGVLNTLRTTTLNSYRQKSVQDACLQLLEAVEAGLDAQQSAFDAVRSAAAKHLGSMGQSDTVARVAVAIAADFDGEHDTTLLSDALVLARIVQAYLSCLEELRTRGEACLNLPFITATKEGPLHLTLPITPTVLAEYAARPIPTGPARKRRRWWWPFG